MIELGFKISFIQCQVSFLIAFILTRKKEINNKMNKKKYKERNRCKLLILFFLYIQIQKTKKKGNARNIRNNICDI
jgi:hypothetical protein